MLEGQNLPKLKENSKLLTLKEKLKNFYQEMNWI